MYEIIIVFVCFIASPIFAQEHQQFNETCPLDITAQPNFSQTEYEGKWYEIKRYSNSLVPGECGVPSYKRDGTDFNVRYVSRILAEKKDKILELKLKTVDIQPPAYFVVLVNNKVELIPHIVLKTDYKTYSIVFGCTYFYTNKTSIQRLSIYSRSKTLSSNDIIELEKFLISKNINVNSTFFKNVEQDDKTCGRKSSATSLVPTLYSGILLILLTNF